MALYPEVLGFRFNHVVSPNIESSNSNLSSNQVDRIILKFLRSISDLIITTGATARAEALRSSAYAPMLILTLSEDELDFPAVQAKSSKVIYLTQKLGTQYSNKNALAIGIVKEPLPEFCVKFCSLNGFGSAVLESGITVAKQFAKAGLIKEVDLTVTEVPTRNQAEDEAAKFLLNLGLQGLPMIQLLNLESSWFFRFRSQ